MKTLDQIKRELSEKRALNAALGTLLDTEKRDMTDDELSAFETRDNEIKALEIEERKALAAINARAAAAGTGASESEEKEIRSNFSLHKVVRHATGVEKNSFIEEMHAEAVKEAREFGEAINGFGVPMKALRAMEQRDNNVTTSTAGGNLVPTEQRGFIDSLKDRTVLTGLGANMLTGLTGNVELPIGTNQVVATFKDENAEADELSATVAKRTLTPKRLPAKGLISKQLIIQGSIDVESWIQNQFQNAIAVALENAAINGSGTPPVPRGILNLSGTNPILAGDGTDGGALSWDDVVAFVTAVETANVPAGKWGYLLNAKTKGKLVTTKKDAGSGLFIWNENNVDAPIYGYKAGVTNLVPSNLTKGASSGICSAMVFGNWEQMFMGQFGGLDVTVDGYTKAEFGQIRLIINSFWDIAYGHAASFSVAKDILTT